MVQGPSQWVLGWNNCRLNELCPENKTNSTQTLSLSWMLLMLLLFESGGQSVGHVAASGSGRIAREPLGF